MDDVHRELQRINRQQNQMNQDAAAIAKAVRDNANANLAHSTMISASLDQLTAAALQLNQNISNSTPAPSLDPSILKMAGEYEVNWACLQEEKISAVERREPAYPHHDKVLKRAAPAQRDRPAQEKC